MYYFYSEDDLLSFYYDLTLLKAHQLINYFFFFNPRTLTEDYLVLVTPVACHLVPFFAGKAKAKSWLSERGSHAALEISQLSAAAIQYYLFRTYIALPF